MKIQELEARSGLDRATIRYYERESLLTPARLENGYRDYSLEDAQELERIVLLRELGISLETIRSLQQGSADFGEVVAHQTKVLESRVDHMQQAKRVCQQLGADRITYRELDGSKYQTLLYTPQLPAKAAEPATYKRTFREEIPKERHPVRRFLARYLDHLIINSLCVALVVMVFRWRPVSDLLTGVISYCGWLLMIPLEALWIHFVGTTPGKWMFGIRITSDNGEKLLFRNALTRAGEVFRDGHGFGIPILELVRLYRSYQQHRDTVDMDWDVGCTVSYPKWNFVRKLAIPVAVIFSFGLFLISGFDSVLPTYREEKVTISEYSTNYNVYNKLLYDGNLHELGLDGRMADEFLPRDNFFYKLENGEEIPVAQFAGFRYETEGEWIRKICLTQEGYDTYFVIPIIGESQSVESGSWIPSEGRIAMIAAVASRPGMTAKKLEAFTNELDIKLTQNASDGITWVVEGVRLFWQVDAELFYEYQNSSHSPIYQYAVTLDIEFLS